MLLRVRKQADGADCMTPLDVLRSSTFGKRTAEEEREQLHAYFVETKQWSRVFSGEIDVVYGPKGSGKSAIYSLISQNQEALFDRNVIVVPGENPQGTPAFKDLGDNPPESEFEFVNLWKLYILTLCAQSMKDYGVTGEKCKLVIKTLEDAELIPSIFTLSKALKYVFDYVRSLSRAESIQAGVAIDPVTGMPIGLTGKIVLREPGLSQAKHGIVSIDDLFRLANDALIEAGLVIWVVLDRLDVAFADKQDLENQALRALFKAYLDTKACKAISTKIFLRTDIWANILHEGFREASHIERSLDIKWKSEDLINLVVRRALSNSHICEYYNVKKEEILADYNSQERFIYRMFPDQVETGSNKPKTFGWILGRTRDSMQPTTPRELIHFLNELRDQQINRLQRGEKSLPEGKLFEQIAFKDALPAVSKVRLEQTLFAEFPKLKMAIEALKEQKATQNLHNLGLLWGVDAVTALDTAYKLEDIGFFERLGVHPDVAWRVPFLYRPSLNLIQGSADS